MTKWVELRRHTASDGDVLTPDGIRAAVDIGNRLHDRYDILVSSGAQRATQTIACMLAGMTHPVERASPSTQAFAPPLNSDGLPLHHRRRAVISSLFARSIPNSWRR